MRNEVNCGEENTHGAATVGDKALVQVKNDVLPAQAEAACLEVESKLTLRGAQKTAMIVLFKRQARLRYSDTVLEYWNGQELRIKTEKSKRWLDRPLL